ncbi:uncharacterized protein LOC124145866 [Haliotis rufescens]|uniref:uncharacterized protein LOC124145866 n=1 Tax=Haliotis rufescens TaxID=6454 RepID=UPI00201EC973|nr:uncharacterized protein LOC124145866 [Haliotis rufescens]
MDITRLFLGVLIIGIVQFEETCSSVHAEGDMTRYDSECAPKNCSQSAIGPLPYFPCQIGHKDECNNNSKQYNNSPSVAFHSFALLATIGTYLRVNNPSLTYSFKTPHGGIEALRTKAVLVDFSCPLGQDDYYKKNPICRVFDFSSATLVQNVPREIKYECLVGLTILNRVTYYYQLKLTSLPSQAETSYTLVIHSEPREDPKCRVVLALAAIPARQSVHVVWERPTEARITHYNVSLYQKKQLLSTIEKDYGFEQHEFGKLKPGYYIVKVEPKAVNNTSPCGQTVYENIQLIYIDAPIKQEDSTLKILLAAISGAVLAVILLIVICWHGQGCIRQTHVSENGRMLLLSASDVQSRVKMLSCVLRQNLHVDVHYDQDQLQQITTGTGLAKWFEDKAKDSTILVVCSRLGKEISEKHQRDSYYYQALKQIRGNAALCSHVYIVCFDGRHKHMEVFSTNKKHTEDGMKPNCFSKASSEDNVYVLPGDFSKLGQKLRKRGMNEKYKMSETWKDFCKEIVNPQPQRVIIGQTPSIADSDAVSSITGVTIVKYDCQFSSMSSISDMNDLQYVEVAHDQEASERSLPFASPRKSLHDKKNLRPQTNLTTLKESSDLDKSCVTLVSSGIACHGHGDLEYPGQPDLPSNYAPDSGFVSSPHNSVEAMYAEREYRQDHCNPSKAPHLYDMYEMGNAHGRIMKVGHCNVDPPQNLHPYTTPGQHRMGPGKWDDSLSGQAYPCGPFGYQSFHDSGHYEDSGHYDDSGQYKDSLDHNSSAACCHLPGRTKMYQHHNPPGQTVVDTREPPGGYISINKVLQHLPTEQQPDWSRGHPGMSEMSFIPRQLSYPYQEYTEESLFQGQSSPCTKQCVNNPLLQRQPVPHPCDEDLQESVPLLNPSSEFYDPYPVFPPEVTERLSSGNEWDVSNLDFCPPDVLGGSDDGSLTFCMEKDESGQFVIIPKYHGAIADNARHYALDNSGDRHRHISAPDMEATLSSNPELKTDGTLTRDEDACDQLQDPHPHRSSLGQSRNNQEAVEVEAEDIDPVS